MFGSFWDEYGSTITSNIDQILKKERSQVTLDEVLDEEDVIQECKHMNSALVDFLSEKPTLMRMLELLNTCHQPEAAGVGDDSKEGHAVNPYAYSYKISEILCCNIDQMLDALTGDEQLMEQLFSLLDSPPPCDPILAANFAKVVRILFESRHPATLEYIKSHTVVDKLIRHVGVLSITELLVLIWGGTDEVPTDDDSWLADIDVVPKLVAKLDVDTERDADAQANAALALVDLATNTPRERHSHLLAQLESPKIVRAIHEHLLSPRASLPSITNSLLILRSLVMRNPSAHPNFPPEPDEGEDGSIGVDTSAMRLSPEDDYGGFANAGADAAAVADAAAEKAVFAVTRPRRSSSIAAAAAAAAADAVLAAAEQKEVYPEPVKVVQEHVQQLIDLASVPRHTHPVQTQFGMLDPPLGEARLRAVELFVALFGANHKQLNEELVRLKALPRILDLFFQYPWNTLLHQQVLHIVNAVLKSESLILYQSLFEECRLLERLIEASVCNKEAIAKPRSARLGYMAFVVQISILVEERKTHPVVAESRKRTDGWERFVKDEVEVGKRMFETVIAGGKPKRNEAVNLVTLFESSFMASLNFFSAEADDAENPFDAAHGMADFPADFGTLDDDEEDIVSGGSGLKITEAEHGFSNQVELIDEDEDQSDEESD